MSVVPAALTLPPGFLAEEGHGLKKGAAALRRSPETRAGKTPAPTGLLLDADA